MAAKPSRDMLTAGLVGSYLLASAWGIMLLGTLIILLQGLSSFDAELGGTLAGFGAIAVLLWLGGAVCEGIGWIGLGRLYPGLPSFLGWLEGAMPVMALLALVVTLAMFDFNEGLAHFMILVQLAHFTLAFLWMLNHKPRRQTVGAVIGYGLGLAAGGTLYALALAQAEVESIALLLLVVLLAGGTIAHLSTGIFFGKSRALADSVNTF